MKTFEILRTLALCAVFGFTIGCESRGKDEVSGLVDDAKKLFRDTTDTIQGYTPSKEQISSTALKQFQDMFAFEYRVIEVDNFVSAEKLEQTLAELGRERWECTQVLERSSSYIIPCRRRPISLLRYALRYLPLP